MWLTRNGTLYKVISFKRACPNYHTLATNQVELMSNLKLTCLCGFCSFFNSYVSFINIYSLKDYIHGSSKAALT